MDDQQNWLEHNLMAKLLRDDSVSPHLYLQGYTTKETVHMTLESHTILFILKYCDNSTIPITFVRDNDTTSRQNVVEMLISYMTSFNYDESRLSDVPREVRCSNLPVEFHGSDWVRSGLCCVVRYLIMLIHQKQPNKHLADLLGFRGGCLRACSEVSSWTKLCEVQIPGSVKEVLQQTGSEQHVNTIIPAAIVKLDQHFVKDAIAHNRRKWKQQILHILREKWVNRAVNLDAEFHDNKNKFLVMEIERHHCRITYTIVKNTTKNKIRNDGNDLCLESLTLQENGDVKCDMKENVDTKTAQISTSNQIHVKKHDKYTSISESECIETVNSCGAKDVTNTGISNDTSKNTENVGNSHNSMNMSDDDVKLSLQDYVKSLQEEDIHLEHRYIEGTEITISDILLFVSIYHYLRHLTNLIPQFSKLCPRLSVWFIHMTTLPHMETAGRDLDTASIASLLQPHPQIQSEPDIESSLLSLPECDIDDEDNLQRIVKTKHRAIQPDIKVALHKIQQSDISVETHPHPCSNSIPLPWHTYPPEVHPIDGNLPAKRADRKYQQIESIVSPIIDMAQRDDVIVDFCAGGGHIGIAVAYLLPQCHVCLVENKEESLLYAKSRIDKLRLTNVTIFQCNLEYFRGHFNIGACLHACGVATDMVQQCCLDNRASMILCPCCYGSVQNTHIVSYPRSQRFRDAGLLLQDSLTLAHAADMTEVGTRKETTGKLCMNLVDWDRAELAREHRYNVILTTLEPTTCTPKHNLIIATPVCNT